MSRASVHARAQLKRLFLFLVVIDPLLRHVVLGWPSVHARILGEEVVLFKEIGVGRWEQAWFQNVEVAGR